MDYKAELKHFLDKDGRLKCMPVKRKMQLIAMFYIVGQMDKSKNYTEKEFGAELSKFMLFDDAAYMRRELVETGFAERKKDGSLYWLSDPQPDPEVYLNV